MENKKGIDARDIRCGNIVRLNNPKYHPEFTGKYCIVQGIQENHVNGCVVWLKVAGELPMHEKIVSDLCQLIEFVSPIELSPEILEKCPEIIKGVNPTWFTINSDFYFSYHPKGSKIYFRIEADSCCVIKSGIIYLHHLQNIIYALTNSQLKIEL